jgi:hypothetical protein
MICPDLFRINATRLKQALKWFRLKNFLERLEALPRWPAEVPDPSGNVTKVTYDGVSRGVCP